MHKKFDPVLNYNNSKALIKYTQRIKTPNQTYTNIGFKCGLEIHQQLKTEKKLFCRCPAGIYQKKDEYDAEIIRHMRPTLSELGEYDGTALMEFKTKKNIFYRIKNETACTYDIDDTPPFLMNEEALQQALEIAVYLKTNIVGELHITRKQYLDGSIPTGFQRTGIIGIEGEISLSGKKVRIIQLSIEEDACREISDIGHNRIYSTDRLGIPLIETVTYPDLLTPDQAVEAANYLRYLTRSSGKVRTGIGAARQDVNVSIDGGTRVEIKGVAHIKWIPELTHNEGFRQRALLEIKKKLTAKIGDPESWKINSQYISAQQFKPANNYLNKSESEKYRFIAVNLPLFKGVLSFFTQPNRTFADEISDRLKVIACLGKPNMIHSEDENLSCSDFQTSREILNSKEGDGQIIFWGPEADITTALDTIEERCKLAFWGVPNETRKALPDGTTIFKRVLPGPDRMYPDTDSAPIPILEDMIKKAEKNRQTEISVRIKKLKDWGIPEDCFQFILKKDLFNLIEKIIAGSEFPSSFVGTVIGQNLKHIVGKYRFSSLFDYARIYDLFTFVEQKRFKKEIIRDMLPVVYQHSERDFDSVLSEINYKKTSLKEILSHIAPLKKKFTEIRKSSDKNAENRWIMGELKTLALGNIDLQELEAALNGGQYEKQV